MIYRIWHGYTRPEEADAYKRLLLDKVLPDIAAMKIDGYRSVRVLSRPLDNEIEFITIMEFDSIDNVVEFVGEDYERAHVPPEARHLLSRFDERSAHYNVIDVLEYGD